MWGIQLLFLLVPIQSLRYPPSRFALLQSDSMPWLSPPVLDHAASALRPYVYTFPLSLDSNCCIRISEMAPYTVNEGLEKSESSQRTWSFSIAVWEF